MAVHRRTGLKYAVKTVWKSQLRRRADVEDLRREVQVGQWGVVQGPEVHAEVLACAQQLDHSHGCCTWMCQHHPPPEGS